MVENMKNNKRTLLGAMLSFALVAIIGVTLAFKPAPKNEIKLRYFDESWSFNGSSSAGATNPDLYDQGAPSESCEGAQTVCELIAPDTNSDGKPDMDAQVAIPGNPTVQDRINDALASGTPNETVPHLRSL